MTFIQWNDRFKVGHSVIDFDHMTLVNITNDLFMCVERGSSGARISQTIAHLIDYVERHFEREETLFMESDYPDVQMHLAMHQDITKTVRDIATLYKTKPDAINIHEVLEFLKKWLTNHILKADQGYVKYIK